MTIGKRWGVLVATLLLVAVAPVMAKKEKPPPPPLPMHVSEDGARYEYTGVVEVEGADAGELYSRAKAWVARVYLSAQDVIQLDDKDAHRLIAKGVTTGGGWMGGATVWYTLTIETKDGRYRYSITDFSARPNPKGVTWVMVPGEGFPYGRSVNINTHKKMIALVASLRAAMEVEADDDW